MNDATDCYRRLRELGIPVLLAFGSLDQKLPRESMTRLHDLLPDIEYHQIEVRATWRTTSSRTESILSSSGS